MSANLEDIFLKKQFFIDYFRSKEIIREDEMGLWWIPIVSNQDENKEQSDSTESFCATSKDELFEDINEKIVNKPVFVIENWLLSLSFIDGVS